MNKLDACPGAPLSLPQSLATSVLAGARGDVLPVSSFDETKAPCLPVLVCRPNDAATMLFSDEPESPGADGVLYADTLMPGQTYRVYVYHANGGSKPRKFSAVVLNQGGLDAHVNILKSGLAQPSTQYVDVGKNVALAWLASNGAGAVTVPAGARVLLDPGLDQLSAAKDELVHAIYDVTVDAPMKLSIVTVAPSADTAQVTAGLNLLPNSMKHTRGTFPGADLTLVGAAPVDGASVRRLVLGADKVDLDLAGTSAVDNGLAVKLGGNYGVRYRLSFDVTATTTLAFSARGGDWAAGSLLPAGDDAKATTTLLPSAKGALAASTEVVLAGRYAAGTKLDASFVSGGGSSLPVDLLTLP